VAQELKVSKLIDILQLEILHRINYIWTSKVYQDFFPGIKSRIFRDILKFPLIAIWNFVNGLKPRLWLPPKEQIIFFFQTKNNYNTIKSIQEITPNSVLLRTTPKKWSKGYIFPTGVAYIVALPFLPLALYHLIRSKNKKRDTMRACFKKYWRSYGLIIVFELYLHFLSPKALILSNDHSREHIIISLICKKNKIPVFFIPHGIFWGKTLQENPMFFDYALVAGEAQKLKIKRILPDSKLYVIGRPLSDSSLKKFNKSNELKNIGICVNLIDNLTNIEKLIDILKQNLKLGITLRAHPDLQNSVDIKKIVSAHKIESSNSLRETPTEFLEKVDGIIAGCSGILLDAAEMNVYPIFYDSSKHYDDFNGFVKNGLAHFAATPEDCVKQLKELSIKKPDVRINAKYYNGTIETENDGKSSELAKRIILNKLNAS
jgi:hypothetical protein